MRLAAALRDVRLLGFDTAPIIYLVEANPRYDPVVLDIVREIDRGRIIGITSVISLGEVLVMPLQRRDQEMQRRYRDLLLTSAGFRTVGIDADVAERAA